MQVNLREISVGIVPIVASPHQGIVVARVEALITARRMIEPESMAELMDESAYPAKGPAWWSPALTVGFRVDQSVQVAPMEDCDPRASSAELRQFAGKGDVGIDHPHVLA